jgi:hypothetical protein
VKQRLGVLAFEAKEAGIVPGPPPELIPAVLDSAKDGFSDTSRDAINVGNGFEAQ